MAGCCFSVIYPLIRVLCRRDGGEPSQQRELVIGPNSNRRHSPNHILNSDVLLNIFDLYRLADLDEYDNGYGMAIQVAWHRRQRWWYKLAHVCRLWRNTILESPSRLDLHLVCTNGVPVADMLAHSPPLPLTIYYTTLDLRRVTMTAEDESGILLALSYRDRVHHISFWMLQNESKLVAAMDDQFPILECMYISSRNQVALPETFQAPNLRHLRLWSAFIPIGSSLLSTTAGLVTLSLLNMSMSPNDFPPSYILTRISVMVQLERLSIGFQSPLPGRDVEGQTPDSDTITLPNLQRFKFQGVGGYLEGLIARISAPSLNTLHVYLFSRPSFTVPRLLQFVQTSKNLTFSAVQVAFRAFSVTLYAVPRKRNTPSLLKVWCRHLDSQVVSMAQLFGSLSPILSVVEKVIFTYQHNQSSEWHNNPDQMQWRELLRPFTNAKVIHVQDRLICKIFHSLSSDDGEPPLGLLPNLEEIGYSGGSDVQDAFTTFLDGRRAAGHPVNLRMVDPSMFDENLALYELDLE